MFTQCKGQIGLFHLDHPDQKLFKNPFAICRSQPNMRQLGSGSQLESSKFYSKSMDRDSTIGNISRMAVSQSAPHTPVSAPNHDSCVIKTVPRLLSEPLVSAKNPSPGSKSLDPKVLKSQRVSPFLEKKEEVEGAEGTKVSRAASVSVPVHSPKHVKKESKFSLRRDTKIQVEDNGGPPEKITRMNAFDGTDV